MVRAGSLLIVLMLVASPLAVTAQPDASRPSFEHVHALAFDAAGRTLWLGAHTGLYRSEDGGRTWAKASLPAHEHGPDVMAIAPHPGEPDVLYVGTHEAGVLKTVDGGRTWVAVNGGLRGLDVHGLAVDPNAPTKLHALVREAGAGLYRTSDGGQKWVRVDDGPPGETKVLARSISRPAWAGSSCMPAPAMASSATPTASEGGEGWAVCPRERLTASPCFRETLK